MEWQVKKLGDVCRLINGRAYKKHEMLSEGKYPLLRVGNFFSNRSWYYSDLELDDDKYCDKGDLLYAWSASFGPRIWDGSKVIYHYHIWKIELNHGLVDKKYLFHLLDWDTEQIKAEQGTGSTMLHVTKGAMENRLLPFPTISEQKHIVVILNEVLADIEQVRAKTEQNLKNACELFESYLQQVFSQRGEGWIEKTLGDVCKFENGDRGKNYPSRSKFVESGFAFINAGHIDDGTVDFSKMNYITEENYDLLSRGKVKQGDILFCLRGSLGKFAVIEDDIQGAIASSLVIVRPHSDLSVSFLLHYLRSGLCKSMIEKYAGGAAQPNLGAKDLAKFSISVPPAAQQLQTSEKLNSLMAEVENLESVYSEKLAALDELKKSILQKAFSGELTKTSDNKTKQGALA